MEFITYNEDFQVIVCKRHGTCFTDESIGKHLSNQDKLVGDDNRRAKELVREWQTQGKTFSSVATVAAQLKDLNHLIERVPHIRVFPIH